MADLYLTYDWSGKHAAYLAVITEGCLQNGDEHVEVMDVELCPTKQAAKEWFETAKLVRPWEPRQ